MLGLKVKPAEKFKFV